MEPKSEIPENIAPETPPPPENPPTEESKIEDPPETAQKTSDPPTTAQPPDLSVNQRHRKLQKTQNKENVQPNLDRSKDF